MNSVEAFATGRLPVLLVRSEPIAYWSREGSLRFTQGVWHVVEAKAALDELSHAIGAGELFTAARVRRISNAVWYELSRRNS